MYTAFYGLREKPFSLTPNPRFLYLAESHREALAHLLYGLEQGEGFIVVSGEVGTGKTTICRTLLERLGAETEIAFLFNPSGSGDEMLQSVNEEFGLPANGLSRRELLSQLNRFLLEKNREAKRVVLIVDEAQNLSISTLEQVRLLSNLETTSSKLIQIILLGQPELAEKLDSPELRQLRQRIGVRWQLRPLDATETAEYVKHRLRVAAGAERGGLFSEAALKEVHRRTGGVPRLVNVLCDRALLGGYAAEAHGIGPDLVKQAAQEIRDLRDGAFRRRSGRHDHGSRRPGWWIASLGAAAAALAVIGGIWIGSGRAGDALRGWFGGGESSVPAVSAPPVRESAPAAPATGLPSVSSHGPGSDDPIPKTSVGMPEAVPRQVGHAEFDPARTGPTPPRASVQSEVSGASTTADDSVFADPGLPASIIDALEEDATDGRFLAHLLSEVGPEASRTLAVAEILRAWGRPALGGALRSDADALELIRNSDLAVLTLHSGDLDEIILLDHPSLLEVRDEGGVMHWVALSELRPAVAFVAGVVERGTIGVSPTALERQWDGRAHVIWSPEIGLGDDGVLRTGSAGESVLWVQDALLELGYLVGLADGRSAYYDPVTRRGVERFQEAQGLRQDGVMGPLTLMRLDDALGRRARPHLDRGFAG